MSLLLAAAGATGADPTAVKESPLEAGYHQMYNLEFDQAHRTFDAWKADHPDDPLGPASMAAAYLFAEFDRLHVLQSEFFMHDENFRGAHRALAFLQSAVDQHGRYRTPSPNIGACIEGVAQDVADQALRGNLPDQPGSLDRVGR